MKKLIYLVLTCVVIASCGDNAKLQPLGIDAVVLAFGDSITYGTGTSRENSYPAVLESIIHRKVINAGIPGEISANGLKRLPHLIQQYSPSIIIICHGGNDFLRKFNPDKTKQNIQQMIDIATENNVQVVIIGVPEFGLFLRTSPIYQELADVNNLPIADDLLGDILSKNIYKSDQIHPNAQGYRMLAENINSLLMRTGALPEN